MDTTDETLAAKLPNNNIDQSDSVPEPDNHDLNISQVNNSIDQQLPTEQKNKDSAKTSMDSAVREHSEEKQKNEANQNVTGDEEYDDYFISLKNWISQFREQEKEAATIFSQSMRNFTTAGPFGPTFSRTATNLGTNQPPQAPVVYECQLAPLWKRFCAEIIDHVILTIVQFYIINILHYGFDVSFADYQNFLLLTSFSAEIAIVEFVSRIMLFLYESYFLSLDYATPGKKILGLKVVRIDFILDMPVPGRDTILASPCQRLGWWHAFFRSILKNLGVLMFPICYGFMLTRYARSGYDYITKTIVIDTSRVPMRFVLLEEIF